MDLDLFSPDFVEFYRFVNDFKKNLDKCTKVNQIVLERIIFSSESAEVHFFQTSNRYAFVRKYHFYKSFLQRTWKSHCENTFYFQLNTQTDSECRNFAFYEMYEKAWALLMQNEDLLRFCYQDHTMHTLPTCNKKVMPEKDFKCPNCNARINIEWIPNYGEQNFRMDLIWKDLWTQEEKYYIAWIPEEVLDIILSI
jgi:hypothetical protein